MIGMADRFLGGFLVMWCWLAGFRDDVLTVCCGGPGRNNYNGSVYCGDPGATTCGDPSASLYWDGVHFTEAANRYIAAGWLGSVNGY